MNGPITCAEFQEHLPELFSANNPDMAMDPALEEHLSTCSNCSALVRDLKYIADQARDLLKPALEEPPDAIWANIQDKLKSGSFADERE